MSNESFVAPWTNPATTGHTPGASHPAGEIRLPQESSVGRRARLLAGANAFEQDNSTIIETSCSMSII